MGRSATLSLLLLGLVCVGFLNQTHGSFFDGAVSRASKILKKKTGGSLDLVENIEAAELYLLEHRPDSSTTQKLLQHFAKLREILPALRRDAITYNGEEIDFLRMMSADFDDEGYSENDQLVKIVSGLQQEYLKKSLPQLRHVIADLEEEEKKSNYEGTFAILRAVGLAMRNYCDSSKEYLRSFSHFAPAEGASSSETEALRAINCAGWVAWKKDLPKTESWNHILESAPEIQLLNQRAFGLNPFADAVHKFVEAPCNRIETMPAEELMNLSSMFRGMRLKSGLVEVQDDIKYLTIAAGYLFCSTNMNRG